MMSKVNDLFILRLIALEAICILKCATWKLLHIRAKRIISLVFLNAQWIEMTLIDKFRSEF